MTMTITQLLRQIERRRPIICVSREAMERVQKLREAKKPKTKRAR